MSASKLNVLVIEDDSDLSFYLTNLLNGYGFEPLLVSHWQEALPTALAVRPALIILDAMLSDDASQQLYGAIKTHAQLKHIPVVMLSSLTRRAFEHFNLPPPGLMHGRLPGPEAVLSKPPEADEFIAVVRELCSTCAKP